jgi:hypothetical protein
MRPIALGRKNWIHLGSAQAGAKIAAILSVIETSKRLNLAACWKTGCCTRKFHNHDFRGSERRGQDFT